MNENEKNRKQELETTQKILATQNKISDSARKTTISMKEYRKVAEKLREDYASINVEFKNLSTSIKRELKGKSDSADLFIRLNQKAVKLAHQEKLASREQLGLIRKRKNLMEGITEELLDQAKQTAGVTDKQTQYDKKREEVHKTFAEALEEENENIEDIKDNRLSLAQIEAGFGGKVLKDRLLQHKGIVTQLEREKKFALEGISATEISAMKQERLNQLVQEAGGLYEMLPSALKSAVDFTSNLIQKTKQYGMAIGVFALLVAVIGSAVSLFQQLDQSAAEFRKETGLTRSQMEGINQTVTNVVDKYAQLGIEAGDVFNVVSALKSEFADFADFSEGVVSSIAILNKNFGVSVENAAKVQGIFEGIGGLSAETAASVQMQVVQMANLAGVAPSKVIADIAESAEAASVFFGGNVEKLAQAAVEARRLGSNLQTTVKVSEQLLDFQSSIESELEAAAFVGGQFNLTQARALAATGETVKAQEEVLRQLQRTGNFREQDLWTQRALAQAAGMSVEEITKQLNIQERLSNMSEKDIEMAQLAIDAGIDITDLTEKELQQQAKQLSLQQEQQAQLEQIQNVFMGIVATVGTSLVPLLEMLAPILTKALWPIQMMADGLRWMIDGIKEFHIGAMALSATLLPIAIRGIISAGAAIMQTFAQIPFGVGVPLGIAAIGAFVAGIRSAATSVEDVADLGIAADGRTMVSTSEGELFRLSPNDDLIAAPNLLGTPTSPGESMKVETKSEPSREVKELLNELRGLRADLREGKIGVYMDGKKVTSSISRVVDNMGTNDYGIA